MPSPWSCLPQARPSLPNRLKFRSNRRRRPSTVGPILKPFHLERRRGGAGEAEQLAAAGIAGARGKSLSFGAGRDRAGAGEQPGYRGAALQPVPGARSSAARGGRRISAAGGHAGGRGSDLREHGGNQHQREWTGRRRRIGRRRRNCQPDRAGASQPGSQPVSERQRGAQHHSADQHPVESNHGADAKLPAVRVSVFAAIQYRDQRERHVRQLAQPAQQFHAALQPLDQRVSRLADQPEPAARA